jgi:hypothetical protein
MLARLAKLRMSRDISKTFDVAKQFVLLLYWKRLGSVPH